VQRRHPAALPFQSRHGSASDNQESSSISSRCIRRDSASDAPASTSCSRCPFCGSLGLRPVADPPWIQGHTCAGASRSTEPGKSARVLALHTFVELRPNYNTAPTQPSSCRT
jgi:hypothetical protein